MRSNYTRFDTTTINGQKLIIVVIWALEIFNIDKKNRRMWDSIFSKYYRGIIWWSVRFKFDI